MFEVHFTKWREGKVDKKFIDRGFADLRSALQHVVYNLPATDMDRIWILKGNVLYAEVKPNVGTS